MLSPSDLFVGCLADATGLCLVLPRTRYEQHFLVTAAQGLATAICLDGDHRFWAFPCADNRSWKGVIIPRVVIELDESSFFDVEGYHPPRGTMVRHKSELALMARSDNASNPGGAFLPIVVDLPASFEKMAVGFTRWQVVLWRGEERQVLFKVDSTTSAEA